MGFWSFISRERGCISALGPLSTRTIKEHGHSQAGPDRMSPTGACNTPNFGLFQLSSGFNLDSVVPNLQ